jgi:hypothetical protein
MKAILGCLAALTILSACDEPRESKSDASDQSDVGRFVIVHSPHLEVDTMLLDTVTGRSWQLVNVGSDKNQELAWQPVTLEPNNGPTGRRPLPPSPSPPPSNSN